MSKIMKVGFRQATHFSSSFSRGPLGRWFRAQPQAKGMLSLPTFMTAWGYMFVASTVLVGILKTESSQPAEGEVDCSFSSFLHDTVQKEIVYLE